LSDEPDLVLEVLNLIVNVNELKSRISAAKPDIVALTGTNPKFGEPQHSGVPFVIVLNRSDMESVFFLAFMFIRTLFCVLWNILNLFGVKFPYQVTAA